MMQMHRKTKKCAALGCSALITASLLTTLPALPSSAANSVCINEVCTKNTQLAAPDGQFYDYIELYNNSSSSVSLDGYGLSDDEAVPYAFKFPSGTTIGAKSYLVIYCGVKESVSFLGADFGLSKDGENLVFSNQNSIMERFEVPALADDTAYARVPDGSDSFAVLNQLSAGKTNPTNAVNEVVVSKPQFSKGSGFYSNGFSLTLSAPSGSTIYYTTNGSDPTTSSTRYSSPIEIYDKSSEENVYSAITNIAPTGYGAPTEPVKKAMIVRAIAVDSQGRTSEIETNSYFIGYTNNDCETKMRVVSLVTDPSNLFDDEKGIYVLGNKANQGGGMGGMMGGFGGVAPANYTQSGREWERPANFTLFENGQEKFSANIGIRIHGAYTRQDPQKSFNIYARSDYGPSKLNYDFFDGKLLNYKGKVIDSFDSLTLRTGANDKDTKIRDRLNQEMVSDRDIGMLLQTECIVFIDGEYWGVYNLMEKISKDYVSDHFKVKAGDVCIIKTDEQTDGSDQGWQDYQTLKQFAQSANFSNADSVEQFYSLCDAKSFADYMATELILGNSDFGNNNYALWKTETVDPEKVYADGKWRFLLFDTEYGQGLYGQSNANTNAFQSLKSKNTWITKMFFGLLDNSAKFRELFVTCYYDLCNENYSASKVTSRLNELISAYSPAMPESLERWGAKGAGGNTWGGDWGNMDWGNMDWGNMGGDPNMGNQDWGNMGNQDWQNMGNQDWGNMGNQDWQNMGNQDWGNMGGQNWNQQPVQPAPGDPNQPGQQPGQDPNQPGQQPQQVDYAQQFSNNVSPIQTFWNSRDTNAKQHLVNYLGNKVTNQTCTVSISNQSSQGNLLLNTLTLPYNSWSGTYLMEMPITISAEGKNGYRFAGWKVSGAEFASGNSSSLNATLTPTSQTVSIQAMYTASEGFNQADVRTLLAYLSGQSKLSSSVASEYDLDGNGKLTSEDLVLLKRQVR